MACVDPGVMEQERTFLAYLQDASRSRCEVGDPHPHPHPHASFEGSGQADYLCNAYSMLRDPHDDKQWKSADV